MKVAMTEPKTEIHPWDIARYLDSDEAIAAYLDAVLEENDPPASPTIPDEDSPIFASREPDQSPAGFSADRTSTVLRRIARFSGPMPHAAPCLVCSRCGSRPRSRRLRAVG